MTFAKTGGTIESNSHMILRTCFILLTLAGIVSCNDHYTDDGTPSSFYESITVDGRDRLFRLTLPSNYYVDSRKRPLVIGLHGAAGSALQFENDYKFSDKAEAEGFIAVYPEGVRSDGPLGLRFWNAGTCCDYPYENNIDDVAFIHELIDHLVQKYAVDNSRVYAVGMSNGGMMAYRLACELPDKFAAIAVVSGSLMVDKPCNPGSVLPILHIHSAVDTKVPFLGGVGLKGYYFHPVDSAIAVWSALDGCTPELDHEDRGLYTFYSTHDCNAGGEVELYVTKDGGHSWPGGSKPRAKADEPSQAIVANDVIWDFFSRYRKG
jgi:polyhydroxybutyrate depolymerase